MTETAVTTAAAAPAAPQPGTPEYDKAMIAKFDAAVLKGEEKVVEQPAAAAAQPAAAKVKPEGVPDQFWNAEKGEVDHVGLAKSYTEAQRKITELSQAQATKLAAEAAAKTHADTKAKLEADLAAVKAKQGATPEEIKKAEDALAAHPKDAPKPAEDKPQAAPKVNLGEFAVEFNTNGKLSDESYKKLADAGLDKATVDDFIAGKQALVAQRDSEVLKGASITNEEWGTIRTWAGANMAKAEVDALNKVLNSGTPQDAALAISNVKAKYTAANGSDPKLLGGKAASGANPGYESLAQYKADMKNPLYGKNTPEGEVFRQSVYKKLGVTTAF